MQKYCVDNKWIPATATFNFIMKDPLLDFLKYHHRTLKNKVINIPKVINSGDFEDPNYSNCFTKYLFDQGVKFENKIIKLLKKKFGEDRIREIYSNCFNCKDPKMVHETFNAMNDGYPLIRNAVVHNQINKTYGIIDLLIRSDWLRHLVNNSPIDSFDETLKASKLNGNWHYRVIDIKFATLMLRADGTHLLNSGIIPAYKTQLFIYNQALGLLQGYEPNVAYLLGRRSKYKTKGNTFESNDCFDKLAIINYETIDNDYQEMTSKALEWLNEVKSEKAKEWNIFDYPLKKLELYPNMKNTYDFPWRNVKKNIALHTKELTSLWYVGSLNRSKALKNGICQWTDSNCCAQNLGFKKNSKTAQILDKIILINQCDDVKIAPELIKNNYGNWKQSNFIEFFVDFETTNSAFFDIKNVRNSSNDSFIFMIGIGYIEPNTNIWNFKDFTVDKLTLDEEFKICSQFVSYIKEVSDKYFIKTPRCFHWSQAEELMFNNAIKRHPNLKSLTKDAFTWIDMLQIFKKEPIVIHGCMSFSLKDVANAMFKNKLIYTTWNNGDLDIIDGQSAMILAHNIDKLAKANNTSLKDFPQINAIVSYNEIDVKVLSEILEYLRQNHTLITKFRKRKLNSNIKRNKKSKF
jgi:hypothetical protein